MRYSFNQVSVDVSSDILLTQLFRFRYVGLCGKDVSGFCVCASEGMRRCVSLCVQISNKFSVCLFFNQPVDASYILLSSEDCLLFSHACKDPTKKGYQQMLGG